jgi:osmotically-inducible protein OsmY
MRRALISPLPVVLIFSSASLVLAQKQAAPPTSKPASPTRGESTLLQALAANPVTAPFRYTTAIRGGKIVLSGRVSTKVVHDEAVRTAIALGLNIDDQLVIDTAGAYQAAAASGALTAPTGPVGAALSGAAPGPYGLPWATPAAAMPYIYPPPLFGFYDDPFYGFQPPVIAYPGWWGALSARRLDPALTGDAPIAPQEAPQAGAPQSPVPQTSAVPVPQGSVEMTVDRNGSAILRGSVPTLSDRVAIGQKIAQQAGIANVLNLLEVREAPAPPRATPPPPPSPAEDPRNAHPIQIPAGQAPAAAQPEQPKNNRGVINVDHLDANNRVANAIRRRPNLVDKPIRARVADGVAVLSGKVPSVLEAMQAFRAAQQTPGIRDVDDRLEFPVPEEGGRNPLVDKARPEDAEPYIEHQIRRQLGDQVHVDRARITGDALEIRGTVPAAADRARVDAILRSMPILRGFRINSEFLPE